MLQTIKGLVEAADIPRVSCVFKSCRLSCENRLSQGPVKKYVLHIKLVHMPATRERESKREHGPDGSWLDDGAECLIEVDPGALWEASQDPPRLVVLKRTIRLEFVFENPFSSHHVSLGRSRNKVPCLVL